MKLQGYSVLQAEIAKNKKPKLHHCFVSNTGVHPSKKTLNKLGYEDMEFQMMIEDSGGHVLGYLFKKNGKYGAYDVNAKLYADFEYCDVIYVHSLRGSMFQHSDLFAFKRSKKDYDIYFRDKLIYVEMINVPYLLEDTAFPGKERYFVAENSNKFYIYDILQEKTVATFSTSLSLVEIEAIHSEYEQFILSQVNLNGETFHYVYNFQDKKILCTKNQLQFTEIKDYYIFKKNGKYGLAGTVQRFSLEYQEFIPAEFNEIFQVFSRKVLAKTILNEIVMVPFEYISSLNKWEYTIELFNVSDLENIFILEDEKEGILMFKDGKKMLYSHYLKQNRREKCFECDEIFYEGNEIFKCYQYEKSKNEYNITYIYKGQAVGYTNSKDKGVHTIDCSPDIKIFTPTGKGYYYTNLEKVCSIKPKKDRSKNFMTIECDGINDIVYFKEKSYDEFVFAISGYGAEYEVYTKFEPVMVWHNLVQIDKTIYNIKDESNTPCFMEDDILAVFNEHLVIRKDDDMYIINRDFSYDKVFFLDANLDMIYQNVVIRGNVYAYFISNEGMKMFTYFDMINGINIFKENNGDNYIFDLSYVPYDILEYDVKNIPACKVFKSLL